MKLALLSDIHSNYVALEECLKYVDHNRFDGVAFLGDYITDCPYPQKTIQLMKQTMKNYKTWCIRGNREEYMLNHRNHPDEWCYNSQCGNFLYTYTELQAEDLLFFENMPIATTVKLENCAPFVICHGSPGRAKELLLPNAENTHEWLHKTEADYLFCGHSHNHFIYSYKGKKLVNCGSVGLSENSQTQAQFLQIEYMNGEWDITPVLLPYDINRVLCDFETSGIYEKYHWWAILLAEFLKTGTNYTVKALSRAYEIAKRQNMPLDEPHWQQAAYELGIDRMVQREANP